MADHTTSTRQTRVLQIRARNLPNMVMHKVSEQCALEDWSIDWPAEHETEDTLNLKQVARQLRLTDIPVSFPTETVHGLGADATRSLAVKGIYEAKNRPADNPLIVHICSLRQLRELLRPPDVTEGSEPADAIPSIYAPLIHKFWPGPLTILIPLPSPSPFAPEIAGSSRLKTFGVRMPASPIALYLIRAADRPIAAPSANTSGKPSPTTAAHVLEDLDGRIDTIIDDGGACEVGLESTVVDGLSSPPTILRPGGVSLEQIRECLGWEKTVTGYSNADTNGSGPRAPGMKYRHYAPEAKVVLFESTQELNLEQVRSRIDGHKKVGIFRTARWPPGLGFDQASMGRHAGSNGSLKHSHGREGPDKSFDQPSRLHQIEALLQKNRSTRRTFTPTVRQVSYPPRGTELWEVHVGADSRDVAHGFFSSLRELDAKGVEIILVEGIAEDGELAAAVMNRMRKAAAVE